MTATELKEQIEKMNSHVLFDYDGKNCGVDPITKNEIAMWFGGEYLTARLEEVMQIKLFAGKSLNDIASEIEIYE
ncbi:MAG: hypothetical protein IKN16_01340 [Selenomonadaceae bacterium]|nr:hypothetical protein [Selenomonadaceae bacterium]